MLKPATLTLLSCLTGIAAHAACDGTGLMDTLSVAERAALDAEVAATPYGTGLAWQATRGDDTILLIGTMHLHDARHADVMTRLYPSITAADLVLVEMTPDEEREMTRAMADSPDQFFITDGPTLPDQLPQELWDEVSAAARDRQMPGFMAAKMQPWFLSITLSMPPCAMGDLMAGRRGLDHMIMETAEGAGIPLASLEEWDTLPDLFARIPAEDQIDMLRLALFEPDLQEAAFVTMLNSYFSGQVAEIWAMQSVMIDRLDPDDRAAAEVGLGLTEDLIMTGRNLAWIPVIEGATVAHDHIVVAAGAAHMPGEQGVLSLLQAEGWTISPLP